MRYQLIVIFFGILVCITNESALSQISGLGFYSYGTSKDLRTGLNLTPDKQITVKEKTELSFSFLMRPDENDYFGYVFRLISEDKNIDLIFNYDDINNTYFTLVQEQKLLTKINADFMELCSSWKEFRFIFDTGKGEIAAILPDTSLIIDGLVLRKGAKYRLSFGLCNYENYRTTDVPAMNIRDIRIKHGNRTIHHWPLDEMTGNIATDIDGKIEAIVTQPMWLKFDHYNWREIYSLESEGNLQLAFDKESEELIIAGPDELVRYSVVNNAERRYIPKNGNSNLLPQRQAVYDNQSGLLYCLDIDKPSVSVFDFNSLSWSGDLEAGLNESNFSHYNKYLSVSDSSLYFFGGYGHHIYKNIVQKYDLRNEKMELLNPKGDFFSPRYLAASGNLNDTIYILGGFGSTTGEQILNPHSYYDLMTFSLKTRTFKKLFEITSAHEDIAFSNSMIIIPDDRSFYVLGFPIFNYNGYLQLIKGSLDKPSTAFVGSKIPYLFLDIVSYSDLFYCRKSKKLLAVTLQNEEGKSRIKAYSLGFPPDLIYADVQLNKTWIYALILVSVILASVMILFVAKRWHRKRQRKTSDAIEAGKSEESASSDSHLKREACHIHFFGDFQVINGSGTDITRKFTPLLKELFLLIWFNSIKNDIGISNEKIIEVLWHGFPDGSAQNNKTVNIAKLRAILAEDFCCELSSKTTGYWKIDYKNKLIINDYYEFLKITSVKTDLTKPAILKLVGFSQKGPFLSNLKYNWLDEFKVSLSNEMIGRLVRHLRFLVINDQPEHIIQVADAIFIYDPVNEAAMENKCKALIALGRHMVAKKVYDHFRSEYRLLYNEDYSKSFTAIANL